jgi:p-cumate 2,3-dioxygenase alpha subunit
MTFRDADTVFVPGSLIRDDREAGLFRVHRSSMTSEEILKLEHERIFDRCWLYLGHDSELAEPGDYRRRRIAGRSIIFVRGKDGEVRAFHNACSHRGAIVCRHDAGNAKAFQCFYHAWTFNTEGELVGIPGNDAYNGGGFEKGDRGLTPVPRLDSYNGFWFLSFRPDIMPLSDYLADAKEILDMVADQSPSGQMKVQDGTHLYSMRANWKLLVENSVDGYHGMPTHQTYFEYVISAGGVGEGSKKLYGSCQALGNGHAVIHYWSPWGRPVARWVPQMGEAAKPEIEKIRAEMEARHGAAKAEQMCEFNRNMIIYPNLVINDIMATTVRTFYPVAPGLMEISAWSLAPVEETGERAQVRLHNFLEFLGPGGFATPDDVEALDSCQLGFAAGGEQWNDISRGMKREPQFDDELQMRSFWRQWAADLEGRTLTSWDDGIPSRSPLAAAP